MTDALSKDKICTLPVQLGKRSYDILIGSDLLARAGELLLSCLKRPNVAIVSDETVAAQYMAPLQWSLGKNGIKSTAITFAPGEGSKSFLQLEKLCAALLDAGVERSDTVIALGGGVTGDLAGFAAAILRRGVNIIQIPTTLLAQVDSSVGGKTGINMPQGKNLVGAFYQPKRVLIDLATLQSLPDRQIRAGYAEIVKYALINDTDFFDWLEDHGTDVLAGDSTAQAHAVLTSCKAKAKIVATDEKEKGERALLNLGHTFGHALEVAAGYDGRLLHGEAVAIGCVLAVDLSVRLGHAPQSDADRLRRHFHLVGLPTDIDTLQLGLHGDKMIELMQQDKKVEAGDITFILAKGIGKSFITRDVSRPVLKAFLDDFLS